MMQNPYDRVPYPTVSFAQTHPNRLATMATLLGMDPAPADRCRVLEMGCASGGNLIPMAYGLPESRFVGIDYSAVQIEQGQKVADSLDLSNLELRHMDILDLEADLGQFDYIIAHGVFSWVPPEVQDKILEVCQQNLAPNGVAYVSYNVYPGWHMIGIVRDMMLYHTRNVADPQEQAVQARAFIKFMSEVVPGDGNAYGSFIKMYHESFLGGDKGAHLRGDAFLLHDELSEVNEPCYFYQFIERAERVGLQYLAEAEFFTMICDHFPNQVREVLNQFTQSVIDLEQYLDFLRNRTFRQTLLCHQDVPVSRRIKPEYVWNMCASSRAQPESPEPDLGSAAVVQFHGRDGSILTTDHPVTKAAMMYMESVWPQFVPFHDLLHHARTQLGVAEDDGQDAQVLAANLLKAYGYSGALMDLRTYAPHMVTEVSERPEASPPARINAQEGTRITNLRHERVNVDELDRYLLCHLDGTRDIEALIDLLMAGPVAEGLLVLQEEDATVQDPDKMRAYLSGEVESRLTWLARAALFVG